MLGTRGRAKRVAVRPEAAHGALPPLPLSLVLAVADRLPADDKLRLAFVSPAFRAVAHERCLHRDVRLGSGSGVGRASVGLLLAVSAKARGTMRTLDVSGLASRYWPRLVFVDAVAAVCVANADTLEAVDVRCEDELGSDGCLDYDLIARLLASAPRLVRLDIDLSATAAQAQVLLRNPAVRVRRLIVHDFDGAASVVALVAALAAHPSVTQLRLIRAPLNVDVALDAVVGFAVERRLSAVWFYSCALGVASVPALARLLQQGTGLAALTINGTGAGLHFSAAFCAALRACTLTWLELTTCGLFDDPSSLAMLAAVTAHPVLQHINLEGNEVRPGVGAALGALVGANAPALTSLGVDFCGLGDEGLRPLVDALPGNTALRILRCVGNGVSRPFAATLLAAVLANTSLRTLETYYEAESSDESVDDEWQDGDESADDESHGPYPELAEVEALVAARN